MSTPYLASTGAARDAADLVRRFGDQAGPEAAMRAERSRDVGNHIHFCRWREAGRLIDELAGREIIGSRH